MAGYGGSSISGFVRGLTGSLDEQRRNNQAEAERQQARQDSIFNALANADDPDVRAAAVTGLLTGTHPASFFDKFMGKTQTHPAFEQIKGLVANGHQPFMDPSERTRLNTRAQTLGQMQGKTQGITDYAHEAGLSPDDTNELVRGSMGAARKSASALQGKPMMIKRADGSEVPGQFYEGQLYDTNWNPIDDAESMRLVGTKAGGAGAGAGKPPEIKWVPGAVADTGQFPGEKSPGGWRVGTRFDVDPETGEMKEVQVHQPAQQTPPSYTYVQTPNGVFAGSNRNPSLRPVPGGENLGPPTAPATNAAALRTLEQGILKTRPAKNIMGGPPNARDLAAWQKQADTQAQTYGFSNFAELQAAVGAATQAVGQAVPQGVRPMPAHGATPPPEPPTLPQRGGKKTSATGGPPSAASAAANPLAGGDPEFVNRVMQELAAAGGR